MENLTTQLAELFTAIQRADVPQVQRLIAANVSPTQPNAEGKTALMVAAQVGHREIMRILCAATASYPQRAGQFFTAGIAPVASPHHQAFRSLADSLPLAIDTAAAADPAPSSYSTLFYRAQPLAPVRDYTALLPALPSTPTAIKTDGPTASALDLGSPNNLQSAIASRDLAAVQKLLKAGADVRPVNWYETPPLVMAAAHGALEIVLVLIAAGADVDGGYEQLPLTAAAANGHLDVVKQLVRSGARLENKDGHHHTALMVAAQAGHLPLVRYLVAQGANLYVNSAGETPLTLAQQAGHQDICEYLYPLIYDLGTAADADSGDDGRGHADRDLDAATALNHQLWAAAAQGNLKELDSALSSPASLPDINGRDREGRTALSLALEGGHLPVVDALLAAGADPNRPTITPDGLPLRYPLMIAACLPAKSQRVACLRQLICAGAQVNQVDSRDRSALMHAACHGHSNAIVALVEAGADLDMRDQAGKTAFMHANAPQTAMLLLQLARQQAQTLDLLKAVHQRDVNQLTQILASGADPNAVMEGTTPLAQAAAQGQVAIAQQLIAHGARVNQLAPGSGLSPLLQAAYRGHLEMVNLLLERGADLQQRSRAHLNALDYARLGQQQGGASGEALQGICPYAALIARLQQLGLLNSLTRSLTGISALS